MIFSNPAEAQACVEALAQGACLVRSCFAFGPQRWCAFADGRLRARITAAAQATVDR
jgi:hypothetical protein